MKYTHLSVTNLDARNVGYWTAVVGSIISVVGLTIHAISTAPAPDEYVDAVADYINKEEQTEE